MANAVSTKGVNSAYIPADIPNDRRNPFLSVHAVNLYVRDQDQSLKFFVEQFPSPV